MFLNHFFGFSIIPLRLATFTGFIFAIIGFFLLIYYIFDYFYSNERVTGWITLIVLLLIIGGLILVALGIIGEYIGRIFLTIHNKPQYVIKEIVNTIS